MFMVKDFHYNNLFTLIGVKIILYIYINLNFNEFCFYFISEINNNNNNNNLNGTCLINALSYFTFHKYLLFIQFYIFELDYKMITLNNKK